MDSNRQYKMALCIVLGLLLLKTVLSDQIPEGCEAKAEWKVEYKWPEVDISGWVSPETDDKILLNIEVLFEDQTYPLVFDSITLFKDRLKFEKIRNGKEEMIRQVTSVSIKNGWMKLLLTINDQYSLNYIADNASLLLNDTVNYLPNQLKIMGSNVTYNCPSGLRMWEVTRDPVHIPLDDSDSHLLAFYATKSFLPSVSVDMRKVTLGWDGETLTTIPSLSQPLPRFMKHKLLQTCTKNAHVMCTIKIGENLTLAEDLRVASIPDSLMVAGREGDSFYAILHEKKNPLSTESNSPTTTSLSSVTSDQNNIIGLDAQCPSFNYIPWILGMVCALIVFSVMVIVITKRNAILSKVSQTQKAWSKKSLATDIHRKALGNTQGKDDVEATNPLRTADNKEHDHMPQI